MCIMRLRLIAISTLLTAGLASAASASTINLLPLGDSITAQGYYIAPLENLLSGAGYTPNLLANEGHSGYIIDGSLPVCCDRDSPRTSGWARTPTS